MNKTAAALGALALSAGGLALFAQTIFKGAFRREDHVAKQYNFDKNLDPVYAAAIRDGMDAIAKLPFDPLYLTSHDGYRLFGRMYKTDGAKTTVILVHGYRGSAVHDFSCAVEPYLAMGLNVLLVTQRAHDESEGAYISFGQHERFDVCGWADLVVKEYGTDVILSGVSMGSTSVLLAACLPQMTDRLRGVIADCGYDCVRDEFIHVAKNFMHLPVHPLIEIVCAIARRRVGLDPSLSVCRELANVKVPVLFVHGTDDRFVPYENARKMFAACPTEKKLVSVEGAGHGLSYLVDTKTCTAELEAFIDRVTRLDKSAQNGYNTSL